MCSIRGYTSSFGRLQVQVNVKFYAQFEIQQETKMLDLASWKFASDLSDAHDAVLRDQPEHTHGNRHLTILQAIVSDNLQSPHLHQCCHRHAEDGDNKTNSHSLQQREPPFIPREPSHIGDNEFVIERDKSQASYYTSKLQ